MAKHRIKNNGYYDLIVEDDYRREAIFIRQAGRGTDTIVISRPVVSLVIAALQEIANG